MKPPQGSYMTLDVAEGQGWRETLVSDGLEDPRKIIQLEFPEHVDLFVPLTEEGVLAAGLLNSMRGLPGVQLETALWCTDRMAQRKRIDDLDFVEETKWNIPWFPLNDKIVLKAGASTLNLGVNILDLTNQKEEAQRKAYMELARVRNFTTENPQPIVEQYVNGPSWEVSGTVSARGVVGFFNTLNQYWSEDNRINKYAIVGEGNPRIELRNMAVQLVDHFHMKSCGFSIEFRGLSGKFKVIEVHCRIGEDGGDYYEKVSPNFNPIQQVYEALKL
jgi:hypothetical protein